MLSRSRFSDEWKSYMFVYFLPTYILSKVVEKIYLVSLTTLFFIIHFILSFGQGIIYIYDEMYLLPWSNTAHQWKRWQSYKRGELRYVYTVLYSKKQQYDIIFYNTGESIASSALIALVLFCFLHFPTTQYLHLYSNSLHMCIIGFSKVVIPFRWAESIICALFQPTLWAEIVGEG